MVESKHKGFTDNLTEINILNGDLPINTLLGSLNGLRINHNDTMYCLGYKATFNDILRLELKAYVVKEKPSNKPLKLDTEFKRKIDKSKPAGLRMCLGCMSSINVYWDNIITSKTLVSDEGILIGGKWVCNKCGAILNNDTSLNKSNKLDYSYMDKAEFMHKYPNITDEVYNGECWSAL